MKSGRLRLCRKIILHTVKETKLAKSLMFMTLVAER